ncbi:flagellar hook-basal body complex protein FliE [Caldimonas tepidiphila]|uniref:flagellar hook-basal body complex protein FliE n=1 Tax=Caldimonas tepidiphila TaxID=2315841 RepID=UPI000E5BD113|nr:flagellar hook-basal body complex protein FliE [Caldimonas tepidiphila]
MEVRLKPFNFEQALALSGVVLPQPAAKAARPGAAQEGGFSQALSQALQSVSHRQHKVADMQRQVQLGNPAVSLEETMVAMQKAQIGFQATLHTRNKLVQAYSDIMHMQV